jgi:hypothetical protein
MNFIFIYQYAAPISMSFKPLEVLRSILILGYELCLRLIIFMNQHFLGDVVNLSSQIISFNKRIVNLWPHPGNVVHFMQPIEDLFFPFLLVK